MAYTMPIFAFLLVFLIIYALLSKTKILGENTSLNVFLAFVVAIIFITVPAAKELTLAVTPWIVVFIVSLVFVLLILAFTRGGIEDIARNPAISLVIIVVIILIFLISGINVLGPILQPFMPWGSETNLPASTLQFRHVLFHPAVLGAIILFLIAAVVAWVLTKFH